MTNDQEEKIPKIFISYSYDSADHEQWVGELASKLMRNGIDVLLDKWDLGLGDDVPKFMETSVSASDRVLMICTESYVRKADEGKGGVGYEATIVTAELVRNLGTSKFIPVVRQKGDEKLLPKSIATRRYVDLSDDQNFDDQFEVLLRELHEVPASQKPPLGKNPFAREPSGAETPSGLISSTGLSDLTALSDDILTVYRKALDIARNGDSVAWGRIIKNALSQISSELSGWRNKYANNSLRDIQALHEMALEGANIYAVIFSIVLAGIESGKDKFKNQIGLIDKILDPRGWNYTGSQTIVYFPDAIACIYQALNGAMCLQTHQLSLSAKLARIKVIKKFDNKSIPLYQRHEIVGWPTTLGREPAAIWSFLIKLSEKWNWLNEPFGSVEDYRESLCAYYLVLNIIELIDIITAGDEHLLQNDRVRLHIPLSFMQEDLETLRRAYHLLLVDPDQIRGIWETRNIQEEKVKELWPKWVYHLKNWLGRDFGFGTTIIHENLFSDIE
ncbi:MAG: toll/interleukin-1 receptor domain-containing protein [Deltaproteobacteria bacterium]|nr:toll/interleukin-1 receptor domain-containing protein [Deltaproteobacteria bacterium]MBF0525923.1 toll/interleukin-1 receptor domain-containing protein [Deltaproteobacteria bacterium]